MPLVRLGPHVTPFRAPRRLVGTSQTTEQACRVFVTATSMRHNPDLYVAYARGVPAEVIRKLLIPRRLVTARRHALRKSVFHRLVYYNFWEARLRKRPSAIHSLRTINPTLRESSHVFSSRPTRHRWRRAGEVRTVPGLACFWSGRNRSNCFSVAVWPRELLDR